jgi:hypothetical protein
VSVTQYTTRARSTLHINPFAILLVKCKDPNTATRLEKLEKEDVLFSSGEPRAERTINLYGSSLAPGLYVVLVGAYLSGMVGQFKISVLTNHRAEFLPIWPPNWLLKGEREKAAEVGVGGEAVVAVKESARDKAIQKSNKSNKSGFSGKENPFGFRSGLKALFGTTPEEDDSEEDDADGSDKDGDA